MGRSPEEGVSVMRKKKAAFLILIFTCLMIVTSYSETFMSYAELQLENILTAYAGKEASLSDQLQIVQNDVNFREAPGGKVLGRLQGGTVLDCLDEIQYKGELWYHARSAEYGEGYVICTFAKPIWNNMNWWPLSETGDVVSDNMVLFVYWMGSYQLDHGLSVIETVGSEKQLSIAPMNVRGDNSLIPSDMKILLASKLFEYGFICKFPAYDQLMDPLLSFEDKNDIAVSVLQKHYGTDDIWRIISNGSVALFIHLNDLHTRPEGLISDRDQMLLHAVMQKIIEEH